MARPIKYGLDYFPFDIDFFSDEKMVAIAGEFGIKGEISTIKLLCAVYRNGYYIEWNEMLKFKLLKELPGVSAELLEAIVKRLVKWGFFDKSLFDSASILTSKGIQKRFQAICSKMHRKNAMIDYCLLDAPDPTKQPLQKGRQRSSSPSKPEKVPQSVSSSGKTTPKPIRIDDSVNRMLSDSVWNEAVCMRYRLSPEQFNQKVANFRLHCIGLERHEHANINDAKRHFCNLLSQGKLDDIKKGTPAPPSDYTYDGGFGSKDN